MWGYKWGYLLEKWGYIGTYTPPPKTLARIKKPNRSVSGMCAPNFPRPPGPTHQAPGDTPPHGFSDGAHSIKLSVSEVGEGNTPKPPLPHRGGTTAHTRLQEKPRTPRPIMCIDHFTL